MEARALHNFGMIADKIAPHRFCRDVALQYLYCLYYFSVKMHLILYKRTAKNAKEDRVIH